MASIVLFPHLIPLTRLLSFQQVDSESYLSSRGMRRLLVLANFSLLVAANVYTASVASEAATPDITVKATRDLEGHGFKLARE